MTNEEKLYLAIGEIDDALIEEAGGDYVRKNNYTKRLIAIAASAAIVTVAVIGSSRFFDASLKNDMAGDAPGDYEPNMKPGANEGYGPESSASGTDGSGDTDNATDGTSYAALKSINATNLTLKLTICEDMQSPIDVYLYSADKSVVYTTAKDADEGNVRRPTVIVNGEIADGLPYESGSYEVKIIFDGIDALDVEWEKYLFIDGFAPIWIGNAFN